MSFSASFQHLCYGSTTAGIDFGRRTLTYKVDPRAPRVNHLNIHPLKMLSRGSGIQL